jgi:hypothetical protein
MGYFDSKGNPLTSAGFGFLAFDLPGFGGTGGKTFPSHSGYDAILLESILEVFGFGGNVGTAELANEDEKSASDPAAAGKSTSNSKLLAYTISEGGGSSPVLQTMVKRPEYFGSHHILLSPIVTVVPKAIGKTSFMYGFDFKLVIAEGWSDDHERVDVGNFKQIFALVDPKLLGIKRVKL